jgi:putative phosphoribosyl transferase
MSRWSSLARRNPGLTFRDRREAGRVLGQALAGYQSARKVVVLGLARGGVPVGWEVATKLQAPLDVIVVRKLGVPQWKELAMGALTFGGVVINDDVVSRLRITDEQLSAAIAREADELKRRERAYRGDRTPIVLAGTIAILVDDGIATGASMLASVRAVRSAGPAQIVIAAPVGSASACRELSREVDDLVCATIPTSFQAVGQLYRDFRQTSDDEVRVLLSTPTAAD